MLQIHTSHLFLLHTVYRPIVKNEMHGKSGVFCTTGISFSGSCCHWSCCHGYPQFLLKRWSWGWSHPVQCWKAWASHWPAPAEPSPLPPATHGTGSQEGPPGSRPASWTMEPTSPWSGPCDTMVDSTTASPKTTWERRSRHQSAWTSTVGSILTLFKLTLSLTPTL